MVAIPFHILFTVAAAIVGVSAQNATFSTCGQTCVTNSCKSVTNTTCFCSGTIPTLTTCLQSCGLSDTAVAQSICSTSTSTNSTSTGSSSNTSTSTSTSSTKAATSTGTSSSTNDASPDQVPFISLVIAIAGAAIGGAIAA